MKKQLSLILVVLFCILVSIPLGNTAVQNQIENAQLAVWANYCTLHDCSHASLEESLALLVKVENMKASLSAFPTDYDKDAINTFHFENLGWTIYASYQCFQRGDSVIYNVSLNMVEKKKYGIVTSSENLVTLHFEGIPTEQNKGRLQLLDFATVSASKFAFKADADLHACSISKINVTPVER